MYTPGAGGLFGAESSCRLCLGDNANLDDVISSLLSQLARQRMTLHVYNPPPTRRATPWLSWRGRRVAVRAGGRGRAVPRAGRLPPPLRPPRGQEGLQAQPGQAESGSPSDRSPPSSSPQSITPIPRFPFVSPPFSQRCLPEWLHASPPEAPLTPSPRQRTPNRSLHPIPTLKKMSLPHPLPHPHRTMAGTALQG